MSHTSWLSSLKQSHRPRARKTNRRSPHRHLSGQSSHCSTLAVESLEGRRLLAADITSVSFSTAQVEQTDASVSIEVSGLAGGEKLDAWVDLNNDGSINGNGVQRLPASNIGFSPIGDLDNDGDLDVLNGSRTFMNDESGPFVVSVNGITPHVPHTKSP